MEVLLALHGTASQARGSILLDVLHRFEEHEALDSACGGVCTWASLRVTARRASFACPWHMEICALRRARHCAPRAARSARHCEPRAARVTVRRAPRASMCARCRAHGAGQCTPRAARSDGARLAANGVRRRAARRARYGDALYYAREWRGAHC